MLTAEVSCFLLGDACLILGRLGVEGTLCSMIIVPFLFLCISYVNCGREIYAEKDGKKCV